MSDENGQGIGVNVYDENEDELIEEDEETAPAAPPAQPVEVVREEIVTVTRNPDTEDNDSQADLYDLVKAHSDQISRLTDMVESLQSQIKRIEQRRGSGSNNKTGLMKRNRSTTKTKKKNKSTSKKPKAKSSKRK